MAIASKTLPQHEAEAAAAAEAAARAAEEEAARRVEEEYELALPDDVRAGVQHALEKELVGPGVRLLRRRHSRACVHKPAVLQGCLLTLYQAPFRLC